MFDKIEDILSDIVKYIDTRAYYYNVIASLNSVKGQMSNRIFNSEIGSKDTEGKSMPKSNSSGKAYSISWGQVRKSKGRQTNVKDFNFTGSLQKSIKILRDDDSFKITIGDIEKLEDIEEQTKREIFALSDEEIELFYEIFNELLIEDLTNIIRSHQ